ncbi:MAG TPA: hypothetical protein VEF06_01450 [Bryobacteraceae bacterium]|nr:hypothetical protein [Bryobacteraceae bacterium]
MRTLSLTATANLRKTISGARDPAPRTIGRNARRATGIVGLMLEDVGDSGKQPDAIVAQLAQVPWAIIELSAPQRVFNVIYQHWIALLWTAALLLFGAGALLSSHEATRAGAVAALIALFAHIAVNGLLRRAGKIAGSKAVRRALPVVVAAGLMLLSLPFGHAPAWIIAGAAALAAPMAMRLLRLRIGMRRVWQWGSPVLALVAIWGVASLQGFSDNPASPPLVLLIIAVSALILSRRWPRPYRALALIAAPATAAALSGWALRQGFSVWVLGYVLVPGRSFVRGANVTSAVLLLAASLALWPVPKLRKKKTQGPRPSGATGPSAAASARAALKRTWQAIRHRFPERETPGKPPQKVQPRSLGTVTAFLKKAIGEVRRSPDRVRAARNAMRAMTILGEMVEDLGGRYGGWKKPGSIITLTGRIGGVAVASAAPQGFGRIEFRHLITVAWIVSALVLAASWWLSSPPLKIAAVLLVLTLGFELAVLALRWWMRGAALVRIVALAGLAALTIAFNVIVEPRWVAFRFQGQWLDIGGMWVWAVNIVSLLAMIVILLWPIRRPA